MNNQKNRPWSVHTIHDMIGDSDTTVSSDLWGTVRTVPKRYPSNLKEKFIAAWWVLTGRADAVVWPEPGDFEVAYGKPIPKQER